MFCLESNLARGSHLKNGHQVKNNLRKLIIIKSNKTIVAQCSHRLGKFSVQPELETFDGKDNH